MILSILKFVGWLIFAIWITWGGFLMMMPLKRNLQEGRLNNWNKIFGYPWAFCFIVLDFLFNMTVGTVMFLDIPRDLLFTKRLDRYINSNKYTWRMRLAYYFCTRFLDPFDPDGYHCKKKK